MASKFTTTVTANTTQHDKAIKKSAQEVYKYQKRVDDTKNSLNKISSTAKNSFSIIGGSAESAIGSLTGFNGSISKATNLLKLGNPYVIAATAAITAYGAACSQNESKIDKITGAFEGLKNVVQDLGDALLSGDWSILNEISESFGRGRAAYDAKDNLGTYETYSSIAMERQRARVAEAESKLAQNRYGNIVLTESEIEQYKQQIRDANSVIEDEIRGAIRHIDDVIANEKKKVFGNLANSPLFDAAFERFGMSGSGIDEARNKLVNLNNQIKSLGSNQMAKNKIMQGFYFQFYTTLLDKEKKLAALREAFNKKYGYEQQLSNQEKESARYLSEDYGKPKKSGGTRTNTTNAKEPEKIETLEDAEDKLAFLRQQLEDSRKKLSNNVVGIYYHDKSDSNWFIEILNEQAKLAREIGEKKEDIKNIEDLIEDATKEKPIPGSLKYYESVIEEYRNKLKEFIDTFNIPPNTDEETKSRIIEQARKEIESYKKDIERQEAVVRDLKIQLGIIVEPKINKAGSLAYLEKGLEDFKEALKKAIENDDEEQIRAINGSIKIYEELIKQKRIELGFIEPEKVEEIKVSFQETYSAINSLYSSLTSLGSLLGKTFDNEDIEEFFNTIQDGLSVVNAIYSVFESFNKVLEIFNTLKSVNNQLTKQGTVAATANAAAEGADTSAKAGNAIAGAAAAGASNPFPYNLIAIAVGIAAVVGALAKIGNYAQGGIIGGSTTVGDHQLAHVNAGEMILNQREQTRLWHMVNGIGVNNGNGVNGSVSFRISGSDLVGVLNNYETKNRRIV